VAVAGGGAIDAVNRYFQAANRRPLAEQALGRIVYGHWGGPAGEDLVVTRRDDASVEIHCHGGRQSSSAIVADLVAAGCEPIDAEAWLTTRHVCPITAAAHRELRKATTLRTATILLDQYHGALRRELDAIEKDIAGGNNAEAESRVERLLKYADVGLHLTRPWQVVIAGEPNVGKSSLINALVGYDRAIVFDQPGTTRDVVSATTAIDGWPVELSDTAGLHHTSDTIETAGIALARERLADADLVVWVLDAATVGDAEVWDLAERQAAEVGVALDRARCLVVVNKIDLAEGSRLRDVIGTCAVRGDGIAELLAAIAERLVPHIPPPGAAVPFTAEQIAALRSQYDAVC